MRRILFIAPWLVLLINSCSQAYKVPVATPTPMFTEDHSSIINAQPTLTPAPSLTSTPTQSPSLAINAWSLVHLNAMANVLESDGKTSVWVVGDDGFIAHISQDGFVKRIDSPERENLYDVHFVSPTDGWAVGANGLILHWDGTEWRVSIPTAGSRWPYYYDLYKVTFTDSMNGWAAGCTGSEGGEYILVYHWDGVSWSSVSLPETENLWACVHDVAALSATDVWIAGTGWNSGTEYGVTAHWNGSEWQFYPELRDYTIYSLSALAPENIWAITNNGIVLHWNGTAWAEQDQLESANLLFARGADDIFAVGAHLWHWDGSTWTDIASLSNSPGRLEIKSILTPYLAEWAEPDVWLLDASGRIYSFSLPKPKQN